MTRDPRIDPRAGDVVSSVGLPCTVTAATRMSVEYETPDYPVARQVSRGAWRRWAAEAKVIKRAEDSSC
jgi:hypothetical protein